MWAIYLFGIVFVGAICFNAWAMHRTEVQEEKERQERYKNIKGGGACK